MNTADIRIPFADAAGARRAAEAIAPDNGGHVAVQVEDAILVVGASAATPLGLLRSIEDVLECLHALRS